MPAQIRLPYWRPAQWGHLPPNHTYEWDLRASLLRATLSGALAVSVAYLLLGVLGFLRPLLFPWDGLFLLAITLICALLYGRHSASCVPLAASWLVAAVNIIATFNGIFYGIRHPVNAFYLLGIILAGMLIGGWFLRLWVILDALFVAGWGLAELNGLTDAPAGAVQTAGELLTIAAFWWLLLILTGWLVWLFAHHLERSVQVARDQTAAQSSAVLEERSRMAREIHDTLAQSFTGIVIQLEAAEDTLSAQPVATAQHLARARELARSGLGEARRSVWALRSQMLEEADLGAALQRLVAQMAPARAPIVRLQVQGAPHPLPPDTESELLRIAQEALGNALKHARAGRVDISLSYGQRQVVLVVADDGRGFDTGHSTGGFGLTSMQERASRINALLDISSLPGKGAQVVCFAPLNQDNANPPEE